MKRGTGVGLIPVHGVFRVFGGARYGLLRGQPSLPSPVAPPRHHARQTAAAWRHASFSRPHVTDDNAFAESVMRTIKYNPAYPQQAFADLARSAGLGRGLQHLVQGGPSTQRDPLRDPCAASPRRGHYDPRPPARRVHRCAPATPRTLDPQHKELGAPRHGHPQPFHPPRGRATRSATDQTRIHFNFVDSYRSDVVALSAKLPVEERGGNTLLRRGPGLLD